ncbi:MAG: polyketide synthase Pks13 [Segniliparus sp.]|uniref:polyketide synthase Pks13 n=1 Tax=Segniliparus sp. TaxID=2804064 RepID=UPI003F2FF114
MSENQNVEVDPALLAALNERPDPSKHVRPDISEVELKLWLREWVSGATKLPLDQVTEDRPMEEFGLSSRDAVALSGDIEDKTNVKLTATVAFMHPTIATLAEYIINGPPPEAEYDDSAAYQRGGLSDWLDVAVVGVSTRFPGGASSPAEMWDLLLEGRDATSERPEDRWDEFTSEPRIADMLSKIPTRGGYLDDVKSFDCEFFSISPTEAVMIDPQQRLAMELTWEALENARIPASELKGKDVGVFLGSSTNDYTFVVLADPSKTHPYAITGTATSVIAGRVSYYFDFHGPAISLDTACSSALVAVHQAVRSLRSGESSVAIAGGVNMLLTPLVHVGFGALPGALAPDGKIKPFSSDSNGFNRSEGGGVLVLKRLADAKRDGDQILAVISGTAVNSDGRSNGLIAPNPIAQADVIRAAYRDAGVHPKDVDYVEAHGTGTPIGDPIEAEGLNSSVSSRHTDEQPLLMGSAKSNFGHLESAAGAVGLIKTVLALKNGKIPPQINFAGPSPYIPFDYYHQKVVTEPTEWPRYSGHAIAGVSGFGFSGTNAHVVLREVLPKDLGVEEKQPEAPAEDEAQVSEEAQAEAPAAEAPVEPKPAEAPARGPLKQVPLVVSAFVPSRRRKAAQDLADWLEAQDPETLDLEAVGRSLAKRNHARARAVVLASTAAEAVKGLRAIADGKSALPPSPDGSGPLVFSADQPAPLGPAWVVSGFGAQHRKMAKQLYQENPVFHKAIDEVSELIEFEYGESVVEMITNDEIDYSVGTAQIGIFAVQIGLAALLRHHGAEPTAIIGHSMAEATCAYLTGGLSLEQAVRVISARARLMGEGERMLGGDNYAGVQIIWPMALVEYSAEDVKDLVAEFPEIEICVYAAPTHTVIGGPQAQVEAVVAKAEAAGKLARLLPTRGSSHCSQMDPLLGELSAELSDLEPNPLKVGFYSSVIADSYFPPGSGPIHGTDYWITNLRHAVWFAQAVRKAVDAGHTVFLEIAPNPVSLVPVAATTFAAGVHDATLLHTLKRKEDESASIVSALVQLWVHGSSIDVFSLFGPGDYVDVPLTAWQRKRLWVDAKISSSGSAIAPGAHVLLPDGRHAWEVQAPAVNDVQELVTLAAKAVFPESSVTALNQIAPIPTGEPDVLLTTILTPHLGGASVRVQRQGSFELLVEAIISDSADAAWAGPPAGGGGTAQIRVLDNAAAQHEAAKTQFDLGGSVGQAAELYDAIPAVGGLGFEDRWDPSGDETLSHRLRTIISGAMGFEAEDLPLEVPLIELGLDSLSALRIKHRVEYDFDIPPIQLQAVRNANAQDVETYVQYAVDNREVVSEIYEQQQKGNLEPDDIDLTNDPIGQIKAQLATPGQEDFAPTRQTVREYIAHLKTQKGEPVPENLFDDAPAQAEAPAEPVAEVEAAAPAEPVAQAELVVPAEPVPPADSGPAVDLNSQRAVAEAAGADVPPRDAAERLTFAAWISVTGKSPGGVFNTLPVPDEETAEKLATRLSERAKGEVTVDDVFDCENIEQLANIVRVPLEGGNVGPVRTLRARAEETNGVPLFLFHPAGGSTIVYEPLGKKLPVTTPIFGLERFEAQTLEERAAYYVPLLREIQGDGPYVIGGWSFGGFLAFAVAVELKKQGADVRLVALIDAVLPSELPPDTPEERRAAIDRFYKFAKRNYGVQADIAPPYEKLENASEEEQVKLVLDMMKLAGVQIPGGMIEHQRASYLDNRAMARGQMVEYDGPVVLYRSERMHDGAIELEPRYAHVEHHGGWGPYVKNLDIVQCTGDHIGMVDEPVVSVVGADLSRRLLAIEATVLAKNTVLSQ